jgi:hypothetical protein
VSCGLAAGSGIAPSMDIQFTLTFEPVSEGTRMR